MQYTPFLKRFHGFLSSKILVILFQKFFSPIHEMYQTIGFILVKIWPNLQWHCDVKVCLFQDMPLWEDKSINESPSLGNFSCICHQIFLDAWPIYFSVVR